MRGPTCFGAPAVDLRRLGRGRADVVCLGVPWDGGAPGREGAADGPAALRDASVAAFAYREDPDTGRPAGALDLDRRRAALVDVRLADAGDLAFDDTDDPDTVAAAVADAVAAVRRGGARPLVLGGDHGVSLGVTRGLAADGDVGLLHLDAHLDLAPDARSDLTHATWATHARGLDHVRFLAQLGVRGMQPWTAATRAAFDRGGFDAALGALGVDAYWSARDLAAASPDAIRRRLPAGLRWHLTIDVDVLAPSEAPETGVPVPLGPTARSLEAILPALVAGLDVVAVDVTEVAGPRAAAAAMAVLVPTLDAITSRAG